ncbi:MAG: carbohydrate binding family 9 domain-containing protein [Pyrinomonadaceae bacterium]|nr:carbohydrate binding family 9 domain-containing protein [Pyrinomonadaceae bacterium]
MMKKALLLLAFILACALSSARAQNSSELAKNTNDNKAGAKAARALPPEKAQPVRIGRFDKAPVIDGKLDDEVWKQAVVLDDFYQTSPGDNIQPSKPTKMMIGYDAKFLYMAFYCYDEPDKIRATVAKRDNIFNEDNVRVFIDTFNDQRRAYVLGFNPYGVQQDGIMTEGLGTDFNVDIVMESKGIITPDGWTVEVAIPFKSLRYEAGKGKLWGFHAWRNIDRFNDEIDSWMPNSRDNSSFLNQAGHLTGLENISTERQLEIIPSLTLSETGRRVRTIPKPIAEANSLLYDPGRMVNEPIKLDPGVTAKFGLTPTVTLDLAVNPDFAQVEADQTVVTANQRFPIFFPEKRPFFLEGIDIFQTMIQAVNTRTIVDPDVAVKLTGKRGRNTFGLMLASDNAPGNFSEEERNDPDLLPDIERFLDKNAYIGVLRLKRDVGRESNIGFLATTYNFIEKHNNLAGFDGRFRLSPQMVMSFQLLGTNSRSFFYDPDRDDSFYRTGNGLGYRFRFEKNGRHFSWNYDASGFTKDYRAAVGFSRRLNTNRQGLYAQYASEPKPKAGIISYRIYNIIEANFDWQGRSQFVVDEAEILFNLQRRSFVGAGVDIGYERLIEEEFGPRRNANQSGAFFGEDSERSAHQRSIYFFGGTAPSKKYSGFLLFVYNWNQFDYDFGGGSKYPRVSPAALADPDAPLDPGPGSSIRIESNFEYKPTDVLNFRL